jgi:hypothetical protein
LEEYDGIIYFKHDSSWAKNKGIKYINKKVKGKFEEKNIESVDKIYIPMYECIIDGKTQAFIKAEKPYAIIGSSFGRVSVRESSNNVIQGHLRIKNKNNSA